MNCYIDRLEGDLAVLVISGREIVFPLSLLPEGAREGDHLTLTLTSDRSAKDSITREIADLQDRLRGGDDQ